MGTEFKVTNKHIEDSPYGKCLDANVECNGHHYGFSKFKTETAWHCDSHFGPDMYPYFCHGIGSRSCIKQIATDALHDALENAPMESKFQGEVGYKTIEDIFAGD